jgi:hypothetical protein
MAGMERQVKSKAAPSIAKIRFFNSPPVYCGGLNQAFALPIGAIKYIFCIE